MPKRRTATRDTQQYLSAHLMHAITAGLCNSSKRQCLIESYASSIMHTPGKVGVHHASNRGRPNANGTSKNATPESAYWYETAATLSKENANLQGRISACEGRCENLNDSVARLSQLRVTLEGELASANQEIMRLTAGAHAIVVPAPVPLKTASIPVNTQGKDAMHWYQTCRTMEAQYIQKIAELESRIDCLVAGTTNAPSKRKKET